MNNTVEIENRKNKEVAKILVKITSKRPSAERQGLPTQTQELPL